MSSAVSRRLWTKSGVSVHNRPVVDRAASFNKRRFTGLNFQVGDKPRLDGQRFTCAAFLTAEPGSRAC